MKMEYSSPELELKWFSFEDIMDESVVDVSSNENSGSGHNDDDDDEW